MSEVPASSDRSQLSVSTKAGFGVGQIAGQLFRDAPSLLVLFYLSSIMGIDPGIAGAAIFIPKVFFGAAFDLAAGLTSDAKVRTFPRRHWLLIGAILSPFAMLGPFIIPDVSEALKMVWIFFAFSFYMAVFSTFSVPYLAQFAEMTDSPQERTELMAWKHAFTGMGILLGAAGTPVLIHHLGGDQQAYVWSIAVIGILCSVALFIAWHSAGRIPDRVHQAEPLRPRQLLTVFNDRLFSVLCISAVVMTIAQGIAYACFAFWVRYAMDREDALVQIGIMSAIMAFCVIAGSPIWVWVANRLGKKGTYLLAASAHGMVLITWGFFPDAPLWFAYLMAATMALFNAGWGLIVLSMLSDAIARSREERGENRAGSYSAIWMVVEKAGIAAGGTLIVGALLSGTGFDAQSAQAGIPQSADAINGIIIAYAFIPGIAKLVAAGIIWLFVPSDRASQP